MTVSVEFDDGVAVKLQVALKEAADVVQNMSPVRSDAVESALRDFAGGYARAFIVMCQSEANDRYRLLGVLTDLHQTIERLRWSARQAVEAVEQQAKQAATAAALVPNLRLPSPVKVPAAPFTFPVTFTPDSRPRTVGASGPVMVLGALGGLGGRSSADPVNLRGFADTARRCGELLQSCFDSLETALADYAGSCQWAPLTTHGFMSGFAELITENAADALWVDGIADGFELAGSNGPLSNAEIAAAIALATQQGTINSILFDSSLSPAEVADAWAMFVANSTDAEVAAYIEAHAFGLANLQGIPYAVQSQAGVYAVSWSLGMKPGNNPSDPWKVKETLTRQQRQERLHTAYKRLGFPPGVMSMPEFEAELVTVQRAFENAWEEVESTGVPVQLLSVGSHNGAMTAGISFGDLDVASSVDVQVSGMNSNVSSLPDTFRSFKQGIETNSDQALVTWIGYDSPGIGEVMGQEHADAGGQRLAQFLDGMAAAWQDNPAERLIVTGHSYGTNVVAEALKVTVADVDAFVSMGSAGLKPQTTAEDLGINEIYVTKANKDWLAGLGRGGGGEWVDGEGFFKTLESRVNPLMLEGAVEFSSEETERGEKVAGHYLNFDDDDKFGYSDPESSTTAVRENIRRAPLVPSLVPADVCYDARFDEEGQWWRP